MRRMVVMMMVVAVFGVSMACTAPAFAGDDDTIECRLPDQKELVGKAYFELKKHAISRKLKDPTGPARVCNQKYPNGCNGECWGCDNRAMRHDECWDSAGEKHVPFWE